MFFPYHFYHLWWPRLIGAGVSSLLWLALLGLLVWGAVRLLSGRRGAPAVGGPWQQFGVTPSEPPATEILRRRYARGEIDADTYQQMLEHLQASDPSAPPGTTRV